MKLSAIQGPRVHQANTPANPTPGNPAPQPPQDKVEISGNGGPLNFLKAHGGFVGSMAGTAIGLGFAVTTGGTGSSYFWGSVGGALGGRIVGNLISNSGQSEPVALPNALASLKKNAPSIGAVAGIATGIALAASADPLTGGAIFWGALGGGIGGLWTGNIIQNS